MFLQLNVTKMIFMIMLSCNKRLNLIVLSKSLHTDVGIGEILKNINFSITSSIYGLKKIKSFYKMLIDIFYIIKKRIYI